MSRASVRRRSPLRILIATLGAGLFAYLVWRAGPSKLIADVVALRWGVVLIIVVAGCSHLAKTWAWALMLRKARQKVPFSRLFALRLGAEAMGQLGIVGQTFGDSIRISYLSPEVPAARGVSSVSLDRGLYFVTGTVVTIVGITTAALVLPLPHGLRRFAGIFVVVLCSVLLSTALVVHRRWPVLSGTTASLGRIAFLKNWVDKNWRLIRSVENMLFDFYHQTPRTFWASFILNLACHLMAVGEVCLIVYFLGARIGFLSALAIEALTKLVNVVGNVNPGNIGTYEAANVLIGKMFGLSTAAGLTLGLSRRVRALFWAAVGGVVLFLVTKSGQRRQRQLASGMAQGSGGTEPQPESPEEAKAAEGSLLPVILSAARGSDKHGEVTSPRVGSLPVLLRAILTTQKTGAERIIVVEGCTRARGTFRELQATGRLPASVECLEAAPEMSLSHLLSELETTYHPDRLLVIEGNRTYHPILFRQASEWSGEGRALAFVTGDDAVGIYVIPSQLVPSLSNHKVESLPDLRAWSLASDLVHLAPIKENLWQRVRNSDDIRSAERKLDRWLVKPTDGFYAQLNRRISIPISRQLIRWPVTPNMVSLFTLVVGFASGILFALGGYWHTLAGAILSLAASILDGCDGEVARLKLMESDFGCWLETVCDYLYYFFLFVGLTLGLERTSGSKAYFIGGAVLLCGAVASFLTVALQRHVLASERPEQLLRIWQEHLDSRRSNLLLFASRHTEFIIRRCFFPYALVFFALFNIIKVAFWLSVVGANFVWPIALYSCIAFRRRRHLAAVGTVAPRCALGQD
jgi:phosphatidylglycerophosphate synthase